MDGSEHKSINFQMYCHNKPHPDGIQDLDKTITEIQNSHTFYPTSAKVYF